jgi:TolB-like protein/Tfp pilus assembly protein PilF
VLPFANLAGKIENEHFADGLADEIINALARIPGLRVTARTSSFAFRGKEQDVREIGLRLGVAALLEGSVRQHGIHARISAQLVSTEDGFHLWNECYDCVLEDVFKIQDDIARSIALALRVQLAPGPLAEPLTDNPEAYKLWLRGRRAAAQFTPDSVDEARKCFIAAIACDPRYPLPYVNVAELIFDSAQIGLVAPAEAANRAKDSVLKALALNDGLGEAHALLGSLLGVFEFNWTGAGRSFGRALELSPGSSSVLMRHAWFYLVPKLQIREAVSEMQLAAARDPLSPTIHTRFAMVCFAAREFNQAVDESRTALELDPGFLPARWALGCSLIWQGNEKEGLAECRKVYENMPKLPMAIAGMCQIYGLLGRTLQAKQMFSRLLEISSTAQMPPIAYTWAYLGLRDDRVFEWLDKAIVARDPAVMHMPAMPYYDSIRNDQRFQALLRKLNLT